MDRDGDGKRQGLAPALLVVGIGAPGVEEVVEELPRHSDLAFSGMNPE
jgi:hypothetical protein